MRHYCEYIAVKAAFIFFSCLPVETASRLGAKIGKMIGPKMGITRVARKNLTSAFPNMPAEEKEKIIVKMWANIGQIIAEYAHLNKIAQTRVTIEGLDILEGLQAQKSPALFVSGHISNWEMGPLSMYLQKNIKISSTYRAPNNPFVDKFLLTLRTCKGQIPAYAKSKQGGRQLLKGIKNKEWIGILIDQKYNEGIPAPFFHKDAMTNPAFVNMAQKFKCPVIPFRTIRTGFAQYKIIIQPPLSVFTEKGTPKQIDHVLKQANALLEDWIKETPEQWLWVHKRWPKEEKTRPKSN